MTRNLIALVFLTLMFPTAHADHWSFPKEGKDTVYEFGNTKIVKTIDATKNQEYPDFILKIFDKDKLLAMYRNVSFEALIPNKEGTVFLGISNSGLPGTAIVIFDANGELRLEIRHGFGHFDYCEESATILRRWFDADNLDAKIDGKDVTFRGCRGNTLSLEKVIMQAYNNSLKADGPDGPQP